MTDPIEHRAAIGRTYLLPWPLHPNQRARGARTDLAVHVRVLDIRAAFDRIDAQVTPVRGTGTLWVNLAKLRDPIQ